MNEASEIQYGLTRIPYVIRRSAKRTTVALTIEGRGQLVLTAPAGVTIDRLNDVVRHKAPWVVKRIRRASDLPPPPSDREFVTGETVLYLGGQYRLRLVEPDHEDACASRHGRWLDVPVARDVSGEERRRTVRRVLVAYYKEHADLSLPHRLGDLCRRAKVAQPSIVVRDQRRRWGSCDAAGTLRINWRIMQAPAALIDYVLAHELVHLRHEKHGREFWAALGRIMPDYEARRARLRELGPRLEW